MKDWKLLTCQPEEEWKISCVVKLRNTIVLVRKEKYCKWYTGNEISQEVDCLQIKIVKGKCLYLRMESRSNRKDTIIERSVDEKSRYDKRICCYNQQVIDEDEPSLKEFRLTLNNRNTNTIFLCCNFSCIVLSVWKWFESWKLVTSFHINIDPDSFYLQMIILMYPSWKLPRVLG